MTLNRTQIVAVLFAVLMAGAVFAPLGAASGGSVSSTALASDATATDTTPAQIDESLHNEEGETELMLFLSELPQTARQQSAEEFEATLKSHAETTQEPVLDSLDTLDAVQVEDTFWIRSAIKVTADLDQVDLETLASIEGVQSVEPHIMVDPPQPVEVTKNVEPSGSAPTYGLEQIRAPETWEEFGATGQGVRVVVADTGVDADHPDIDLADWYDPMTGSDTPSDSHGHGTHTSGTATGGDSSGTAIGVAPDAELAHVKVCGSSGCGGDAIMESFQIAIDTDSDVINLSLGGGVTGSYVDTVYNAMDSGVLVVSSIGNDGEGTAGSPGAVYDSIASGATNENEEVTSFSGGKTMSEGDFGGNWMDHWPSGEFITPDIAAPGAQITSAQPGGGYQEMSGTSMSSPHKAGAAAVILSANPDLGPWEVQDLMMETAWKPDSWDPNDAMAYNPDTGRDTRYGTGIIDLYAAVEQAGGGGAQGTIEGTVTDESGAAIEGATVSAGTSSTQTDSSGNYELTVSADTHTVTAEASGYESSSQSVTVGEEETVRADFTLAEFEGYTVGVVSDGSYGSDVASMLEGEFGSDVMIESISSSEAIDSDHDVYVVQNIQNNAQAFYDATSGSDTGVVYLDQWSQDSSGPNGVEQLASVSSAVDGVSDDYQSGADGPYYAVQNSHPIVEGLGDSIEIHTSGDSDHAWATGTSYDVIADVEVDGSSVGTGLAVDESSSTVLATSSGLNEYVGSGDHTSDSVTLLANAVDYLASGEDDPEPEGSIQLSDASGSAGDEVTVTLSSDVADVSGYQAEINYDSSVVDFVSASGVDLDDPQVNDESGTLGLAVSGSSSVDAPAMAELTFELTGSAGDSTQLSFGESNTELAAGGEIVQPSEYRAGTIDVSDGGAPPEGFIRVGDASAGEGGEVTVSLDTDLDNIAGYQAELNYDDSVVSFVEASGVDIADPTVNDEPGTLTLSASQTNGVDAPTLADLTFELTGSAGDTTTVSFNEDFTQLNTEDSVVQPADYIAGELSIEEGCGLMGDVDGDGQVTSLDATKTQQHIAGLDPGNFNEDCADLTEDGQITPADVTAIHQTIVGMTA
ncbi:S8 family serine peptidase [Halovivax limisalsi]|uniref:S8 family serine peptidase n=1 Tax=Halovivax limisalsi TaxID=1453760 RepID=UPI001FFD1C6F|nr:S8 family serine peptidase [Halovivax limisalsi]